MEANELCAICDAKFAGKQELIHHANEIHQKTTNPTKSSRNIAPPKRLANQLLQEFDKYAIKQEDSAAKKYWISVEQIIHICLLTPITHCLQLY